MINTWFLAVADYSLWIWTTNVYAKLVGRFFHYASVTFREKRIRFDEPILFIYLSYRFHVQIISASTSF